MATAIYPPVSPAELLQQEGISASNELNWLLTTLPETLASLRHGLHSSATLLSPHTTSTLALTSPRSEALKGFVTRCGPTITKGDITAKLLGLPPKHKLTLCRDLRLDQLTDVKNHVRECLALLGPEGAEAAWLGQGRADAARALEKLRVLRAGIAAARAALKGAGPAAMFPCRAVDPRMFDPPLPPLLAFDLYITEAALTAELRTLEPVSVGGDGGGGGGGGGGAVGGGGFGFGQRFAAAVGLRGGVGAHGEGEGAEVFVYRGASVRVRERVKVESQDPNLMAVWAKLGGVEHALVGAIKSLEMVAGAAGVVVVV
ncbi:uncharacterized protein H6S33_002501 [Morchella sextelata]|uniref:uncharacterized protein n=1 Tax=Morchella sextelata TaxID=1174677 RepID=UPI001D049F39|nr:uncharacterized protein H6S33_002501 [Morchella sextelata]KAH0607467.1 hypothetical protein H6S33_002501 [Morchella sextelata]